MPLTRPVIRHELVRRDLEVVRLTPLSPAMTRITLGGPDLAGFAADGPADHLRLGFPATDAHEAVTRDYTPLAFREAGESGGPELDIDFVLHGADQGADDGPASAWALAAAPGDRLSVGGPRGSRLVPEGVTRLVIVADATALPAASRWLSQTPPEVPVTALLRISEAEGGYLGSLAAARATAPHLQRIESDADLEPALRALAPFDETTFVFLAGEAGALIPLRRYLRRELGLSRDQVQASGYWRRGIAGLDHHAPVDPDDPED